VIGSVAVIFGILAVVFRRRLGEYQVRSQNELWGFRMGPRSITVSRSAILIVGLALVVMGALMLAGVGKMRQ
jgi:hypothetical protein